MPDWSILAIFTLIAFFAARATKELVKYVLYIVTLILAGSTVGAALSDWRVVFVAVLILTGAVIALFVRRQIKSRKKNEENGPHVHIHNHFPH